MGLSTYDYNMGAFDNVKANVLADRMSKNRWGNKFKKLYVPYKNVDNTFDFTNGMLNCVGTDVEGTIEELSSLRTALNSLCELTDGSFARNSSYFSILVRNNSISSPTIKDIKLSISVSDIVGENDNRAPSIFCSKNDLSNESNAFLEPLLSYYERKEAVEDNTGYQKPFSSRNPFSVTDKEGNSYGYIDNYSTFPTTNFDNIHDLFGVEDLENTEFLDKSEYETRFSDLLEVLDPYLNKFLAVSSVLEDFPINADITVVYPVNALDFWLKEIHDAFLGYFYNLGERTTVELELIEHLGLCETLTEQIGGNAGEIRSIWFKFEKEIKSPSLIDPANPYSGYDPNYEWWKEEQFDEIRKKVKNFKIYFDYVPGTIAGLKKAATPSIVILKTDGLENISGYKIFWIVSTFLNVDSRTKGRSFLERLFSFVLVVVAVYLTVISENPAWLKVLMIGTTLLSVSGTLSPKAQMVATVVAFVYGAYNTNYTSLSGMEMFRIAIKNIDMVLKMKELYDAVKMENDEATNSDDGFVSEKQDMAIEYIYTDAYSQYDDFYSVFYDFEPNYK